MVDFAKRKQAGAALVQAGRYAEAEAEYAGALSSMSSLLDQLPSADAAPLRAQMAGLEQQVRREMEDAQAKAGGDAEAIQRTADAEREKRMRMEQELAGQQEKER